MRRPAPQERPGLAGQRDERVGRDVERQREALAGGVDEAALEILAPGEGEGVDEDVERLVRLAPSRSKTARICSSAWTSQGSTNVDPIDSASGRTRRSMRLSTDEKPTSAPSSWSAWAIPQAIEWSLATPKISAFLPSSSPIRLLLRSRAGSIPRRDPSTATPDAHRSTRPPCAARSHGVRGAAARPRRGDRPRRARPCRARSRRSPSSTAAGCPYRIVTNTSLVSRATLVAVRGEARQRHPARAVPVRAVRLGRLRRVTLSAASRSTSSRRADAPDRVRRPAPAVGRGGRRAQARAPRP